MRTKSAQASAVLNNPSHSARAIVTTYSSAGSSNGTLSDELLEVEIEQSIDGFRTARVSLQRQQGAYSFAPLVTTGNPFYGSEPRISIGRRILIEAELILPDISNTPSGLKETIFDGYIDEVSWPDDEMQLVCTDKSAKLRDTWIEYERVYGYAQGAYATKGVYVWRYDLQTLSSGDLVVPSEARANGHFYRVTTTGTGTAAEPTWPTGSGATVSWGSVVFTESGSVNETGTAIETIIQQVLNDNGLGSLVTLQTPVSPSWNVKPYIQQRQSVMDAIRTMVDQLGWWVRFEWSSGLGRYELTLKEPARTSSTVHKSINAAEEIDCQELSIDVWSIRNVVRVIYGSVGSRSPTGSPVRVTVEVSDSTSITKYGRRFMEIAEGDSSNIDTLTEAQRMANAALADLKDPTAGLSVSFPCDFYLELGDRLTLPADGLRSTSNITLAVESLRHSFGESGATTSVTLRGTPAAMRDGWLAKDGLVKAEDVHQVSLFNSTSIDAINISEVVGGMKLEVNTDKLQGSLNQGIEFHVSDVASFSPGLATLMAAGESNSVVVPNLVPGKTYYFQAVPFSRNASRIVRGSPSAEQSFVAGRAKSGHYDSTSTQSHLPLNGNFEHATDSLTTAPPDHWKVSTLPSETAEAWGSGGSVYYGTDTGKGRYIRLRESATQRGRLISNPFEVRRGIRSFNIYASIRRNGSSAASGKDLIVDIFGFSDAALTTQIINYSVYLSGSATGPYPSLATWYDVVIDFGTGYGTIPTNVNFLQLVLRRGTAGDSSFSWDVGDIYVQEADFYRATIDQVPWYPVTFGTGWANYDAVNFQCEYLKDSMGFVHLRGLAQRTSGSGATITTLPSGCRPLDTHHTIALSAGAACEVDIDASGNVVLYGGTPTDYVSLDNVVFHTT